MAWLRLAKEFLLFALPFRYSGTEAKLPKFGHPAKSGQQSAFCNDGISCSYFKI